MFLNNKISREFTRKVVIAALSIFLSTTVSAKLVFVTEENAINEDNFILNADDTATNFVDLEFGSSLGVKMRYDILNNKFILNKDLDLGQNQITNLRIENLSAAPTCNAAAIGQIYYNTTDKLTYTCDGVSVWNPLENALNATIEFPVVQARRTTSYTLTTSYADVTLDTTDLENDITTLDHDDTNRDRINIGTTAMYQIIYGYTAGGSASSTHEARARVRVNDATVLTGSESVNKNYQGEFSTTSASFLTHLNAGDFISLQLQRDSVTDVTQDEIYFSITKLEGIKGEKGDPGPAGAAGPTTDSETFTIDNDNTGGDLSLIFGLALNESLTWNSANSRFDLSDTLRVLGNLEQDGNVLALDADNSGAGANVDIVANQGTDNDGTLRYNATTNKWEFSNDGGILNPFFVPEVFYAYDSTGGQTINNTEITLNLDSSVINDLNYSLASDQVRVTDAGLYRITLDAGFTETNTTGGARTSIEMRLQENGTDIPGAMADCYLRESEENSCSLTILENISASGIIRARLQRTGGSTNVSTLAEASRIIIERIR